MYGIKVSGAMRISRLRQDADSLIQSAWNVRSGIRNDSLSSISERYQVVRTEMVRVCVPADDIADHDERMRQQTLGGQK